MKKSDEIKLTRHIKEVQAKSTNPGSWRCRFGIHKYYVVASYGFIMSYTEHCVCARCGKHIVYEPCRESY